VCGIPLNNFFSAGLMVMNSFSFCLLQGFSLRSPEGRLSFISTDPPAWAAAAAVIPSKFIYRQLRETGQGFESFLADRGLEKETDGERLQTIYNRDFKTSFGTPAPGFSSMLYGMKIANLAYVTKTQVRFFSLDPWVSVQLPEETNEAGVRYQQAAQVTASQDLL
jgi:hypothetical protein